MHVLAGIVCECLADAGVRVSCVVDQVGRHANGNVTFADTIEDDAGGRNLGVNAAAGTVNFDNTVGAANALNTLTVTASTADFDNTVTVGAGGVTVTAATTIFDNTVSVGAGGLTVNGSGGTTTLTGDITTAGNVEINDSVILAATTEINPGDNNISVLIGGTINGTTANTEALTVNSGTATTTLEGNIGNLVTLSNLTIDASGETELNGEIRVGTAIDLSAADNVQLGSDVSMVAGTTVTLDEIDGAFALVVDAGTDITVNDGIGGNEALSAVTLDANNELTVNAAGDITSTGLVTLIARTDDVNLIGNLIGNAVFVNAAANLEVTGAQDNTSGSTSLTAGTEIDIDQTVQALTDLTLESASNVGANLNAGQDLTVNGIATLSAAVAIGSTNGSIDLNADITGDQDLDLTGLVLAKLDSTAKGGVVIAIADELGLPVQMVGLGEGIEDLRDFDPEAFVEALFEA